MALWADPFHRCSNVQAGRQRRHPGVQSRQCAFAYAGHGAGIGAPHIQFLESVDADEIATRVRHSSRAGLLFVVRGWKCRTLDECIRDLSWFPRVGYVVLISWVEDVLHDEMLRWSIASSELSAAEDGRCPPRR